MPSDALLSHLMYSSVVGFMCCMQKFKPWFPQVQMEQNLYLKGGELLPACASNTELNSDEVQYYCIASIKVLLLLVWDSSSEE